MRAGTRTALMRAVTRCWRRSGARTGYDHTPTPTTDPRAGRLLHDLLAVAIAPPIVIDVRPGCGCGTTGGEATLLVGLVLLAIRTRSRR